MKKPTDRPDSEPSHVPAHPARRRLMGAVAAGAVVAVKGLPERWTKPVVDSVILPAHAQMSPQCEGTFSQTEGYDIAQANTTIPDQTFTFNLGGAEPCGDGTVSITNLAGDLNGGTEQWTIWLGSIGSGENLGQTNNSTNACESAPDSTFSVPLAQLEAAISGGSIQIEAQNGGGIDSDCATNTMDVTLEFPTLT